jgi:predicted CXXCH cytochrome family protein
MFDKGVRCSNCHNPHSSELKAPGNAVCLQCHNTAGKTSVEGVDGKGLQAKNYDSIEHTRHTPGQPGLAVRGLPHARQVLHGQRLAP